MRKLMIVLLCCLLLAGCTPVASDEPTQEPRVKDIPALQPTVNSVIPYEINSYGFDGDLHLDGDGIYYLYEGGEMCITTFHRSRYLMERGIAIFLYVDGQAQPFHTEAEPEDAYLHRIYPMTNRDTFTDLYFTPLTGEAGEVKEICVISIANPDYFITDDLVPFANPDYFITDGLVPFALQPFCSIIRMKYEATPPACEMPAVQERVLSWTSTCTERQSDQRHVGEIDWRFHVAGKSSTWGPLRGIWAEEPLTMRFELWGDPAACFGLILYVDHQPVSVAPENIMLVQPIEGQRLIIEAQIDLSDFDGSSVVYAMLIPRNYRSNVLGSSCEPSSSGFFYLTGEE